MEASVVGEVEAIVEEEEVEGVVAGVSLQKFDSGLAFICLEYGETALKDSTAPLGKASTDFLQGASATVAAEEGRVEDEELLEVVGEEVLVEEEVAPKVRHLIRTLFATLY